jgi:hypothetical protein
MRLSPPQAAKLAVLSRGESLPKREIPKKLLLSLREAHAVRLEKSGSSYVVRGIPGRFTRVVEQIWGVRCLDTFATATPETRDRTMLASIAGNTKALATSPLKGIFLRSFGECYLKERPLGTTPPGASLLVNLHSLSSLRVGPRYLIGIENVECLWTFENALRHFPALQEVKYALVLRWHWSAAWWDWLRHWKGQFFHFPDYDPSGLRIFTTEILPHRPDARLLIPQDFENILEKWGNRDLYLRQEKDLPLNVEHPDLVAVCGALKKTRKAFEQEILLSK